MAVSSDFRVRLLDIVTNRLYGKARPLLIEELERGTSRDDLFEELMDLMLFLRAEDREADEDEVADIAELMTSWALPEFRV
ncbi:hypothetical protein ACFORH_25000 [Amycolatopsis roodepoortensis]|uniref:Uncharacterized protein n=1 Tax=Amycolatopsis roodepoortensis TaxID=700274 RepID=A0ABR9LKK4_9PSEU|nr:hypothetical protein [Amycolatopsis roodepoortensis]MBE1581102.1 hypothetical protein [Amycolatopsis roodepoortensis]